jgi:hypothetical protein
MSTIQVTYDGAGGQLRLNGVAATDDFTLTVECDAATAAVIAAALAGGAADSGAAPSDNLLDDDPPAASPPPPVVQSITMTTDLAVIHAGDAFVVTSVARYTDGREKTGFPNRFGGFDSSVIGHDGYANPRFTAAAPGTTVLRNSYGGTTGETIITVLPPPATGDAAGGGGPDSGAAPG